MKTCMHCNAQIGEEGQFCPVCGKKQVEIFKQTFQRDKMSQKKFIEQVNLWFASNPQVANVKASVDVRGAFGLLVNSYKIRSVTIEYELFKNSNENQYALTRLSQIALIRITTDHLVEKWKKKNPGASLVARGGGRNARGQLGSLVLFGLGAFNRADVFVLYKYNRKKGPEIA